MGNGGVEHLRHHTVATQQNGWAEEIMRDSRNRAIWRKLVQGAARAADHHS